MSATSFHFLVDTLTLCAGPANPAPLEVPAGVSFLANPLEEIPYISVEEPAGLACALEPVQVSGQPRLLLLSPPELRVRVNGQPAPRVALLSLRDQVQLAGGPLLHVTIHQSLHVGPPPAESLGKECPVCRDILTAERIVYVCPSCGTAIHSEGENGLDCINIGSECPACPTALIRQSGYAYQPEL